MATRLLKVSVVTTENDTTTITKRFINPADVHEAYPTTFEYEDETRTGTMVERFVPYGGNAPQHVTIDEELSDFVARFNALMDCPPCPEPNGGKKS